MSTSGPLKTIDEIIKYLIIQPSEPPASKIHVDFSKLSENETALVISSIANNANIVNVKFTGISSITPEIAQGLSMLFSKSSNKDHELAFDFKNLFVEDNTQAIRAMNMVIRTIALNKNITGVTLSNIVSQYRNELERLSKYDAYASIEKLREEEAEENRIRQKPMLSPDTMDALSMLTASSIHHLHIDDGGALAEADVAQITALLPKNDSIKNFGLSNFSCEQHILAPIIKM